MTAPLWSLLAFAAWTVALLLGIGAARVGQVLAGRARPNEFPGGVPHGGDRYWRLNRAHLNCLEFLPLFGAVVLVDAVSGLPSGALDALAPWIVAARVGQSTAHVASGSSLAVNVRFGFFLVQVAALIAAGAALALAAGG